MGNSSWGKGHRQGQKEGAGLGGIFGFIIGVLLTFYYIYLTY
jgi:tetrahydromethanopterin S-methyltransferase subunit G